jgi:hypothetical protein
MDGRSRPNSREVKAAIAATTIASRPVHANIGREDRDNSVSGGHKATMVLAKLEYACMESNGFALGKQLIEGAANDRNDP